MDQDPPVTQVPTDGDATLTIGDLARRTGLTPPTLRTWETRHGFPQPKRLASGHRRYDEQDVELVNLVLRRQRAGIRLEVAIGEAAASTPPGVPSVYASLRSRHAHLQPDRLRKSTLIAISWAMEDECCARAERPILFGSFQDERYYRAAEERWVELGRVARSAMVFADFSGRESHPAGAGPGPARPPHRVHLPADAPMRREWAVVCDAPDYPALLTAWELPGQSTVPDGQRMFEAIWTVEPAAARDAARTCAQVAQQLGHDEAAPLLYELAGNPPPPSVELRTAASLLSRVVAYVDGATGDG